MYMSIVMLRYFNSGALSLHFTFPCIVQKVLQNEKKNLLMPVPGFGSFVHLLLFSSPPGDENLDPSICSNVCLLLQNVSILLLDYTVS